MIHYVGINRFVLALLVLPWAIQHHAPLANPESSRIWQDLLSAVTALLALTTATKAGPGVKPARMVQSLLRVVHMRPTAPFHTLAALAFRELIEIIARLAFRESTSGKRDQSNATPVRQAHIQTKKGPRHACLVRKTRMGLLIVYP
jgi:hypothetical protein